LGWNGTRYQLFRGIVYNIAQMVVKAELQIFGRKIYTFKPRIGTQFKERGEDDGYSSWIRSDDVFKRTRIVDSRHIGISEEWEKGRKIREANALPPKETILAEGQIDGVTVSTPIPGVTRVLRYEEDQHP
jgi:hypothetical protein